MSCQHTDWIGWGVAIVVSGVGLICIAVGIAMLRSVLDL